MTDRIVASKQAVRERIKRSARPVRLVAAGVAVLIGLTGLWLWHQARMDAAAAAIVALVPQAEQALSDRDFAAARRSFGEAVAAIDLLGADDPASARIRQRHRELVAVDGLASQTPYDLAAQAETLVATPADWSERFQASYAGRWVIFDVPFSIVEIPPVETTGAEPTTGAGTSPDRRADLPRGRIARLDLPLAAGDHPVRFEIDATLFASLKPPRRAIFAAQYASWRLRDDVEETPIWVVRFRPDTAFLWASPDIYEKLGIDLDGAPAPPRSTLMRQVKALGIPDDDAVAGTVEELPRP